MSCNQKVNRVIPMVITPEAAKDFELEGQISQVRIGGIPQLVHYVPCDQAVYDAYMQPLNAELKTAERAKRCAVPGKHGKLVRCPDNTDCDHCPYGYDRDDCKPSVVSLEALEESGLQNADCAESQDDVYFQIRFRASIEKLRLEKDGEELALVFAQLYRGASRAEIAKAIGKSERCVGELVLRIRELLYDDWHNC